MRGTYTLVVDGEGDVVEVQRAGRAVAEGDADKLVAAVERLASGFATVAICGSLPAGAPVDLHARLVAAARAGGGRAILDCSTVDAFAAALEAEPDWWRRTWRRRARRRPWRRSRAMGNYLKSATRCSGEVRARCGSRSAPREPAGDAGVGGAGCGDRSLGRWSTRSAAAMR